MSTELLAPAGSIKNMHYAFAYGADAVYAGQLRYSLRVRNNEFNHLEKLAEGIEYAHGIGKRFYIASNISAHNNKVKTYLRDMTEVMAMRPDAVIMSDPGLIMLVREQWPEMPVHLSVQANAVNWAAVKFWHKIGLTRIILSRELSLDEIAEIRQNCPEIELEVFVHGALCIAYSGRCLLSGYMTHRDANQGACTNSCRWKYQLHDAKENLEGNVVAIENAQQCAQEQKNKSDSVFLLQEKNREGEYMPIYEDEHGTYIMNSRDLRAVQHVQRLIEMGIDSLKIEGRTKSYYYAARTAQVYRRAMDAAFANKPFDMNLMTELEGLSSRGYTEGFYRRHLPAEYQNYENGSSESDRQQFVGEVLEYDVHQHCMKVDVKNQFGTGSLLELITPNGNVTFQAKAMESANGNLIEKVAGSGCVINVYLPDALALQADQHYSLLVKNI